MAPEITGYLAEQFAPMTGEGRLLEAVVASFGQAFDAIANVLSPSDDEAADPRDVARDYFLASLSPDAGLDVLKPNLGMFANELWVDILANRFGGGARVPRVFHEVTRKKSQAAVEEKLLIEPAPPDRSGIAFRAQEISTLLSLIEKQRVMIVTAQVASDAREFILPDFVDILGEKGTPHTYINVNAADGISPFADPQGKSVFIVDLFDYTPWQHESEHTWLAPLALFVERMSGYVPDQENRFVILLNSNMFAHETRLTNFLPFLRAVGLGDLNYPAIAVNSKLMSVAQSADYLGVDISVAQFIASRIPLLPQAMMGLKELIDNSPDGTGLGGLVRNFVANYGTTNLIVSNFGTVRAATRKEFLRGRTAFSPRRGYNLLLLGDDGSVTPLDAIPLPAHVENVSMAVRPANKGAAHWRNNPVYRIYHDLSPTLRSVNADDFETAAELVEELVRKRPAIAVELRDAIGSDVKSLVALVQALVAAEKLTKNVEQVWRLAGSRDLFDRSPILQGIQRADYSSSEKLAAKLAELRPAIEREQTVIKNSAAPVHYSLASLVQAMIAGGRVTKNAKRYTFHAAARDFFEGSPILKSREMLTDEVLASPEKLISRLVELRPFIIREQQELRRERRERYSLRYLIDALEAGGRIKGNFQTYERRASSRDMFDFSPTLRGIPNDVLEDNISLIAYLLTHKDRIAVEVLHARGDIEEEQYVFSDAWMHYALTTLLDALRAGGRMDDAERYNFIYMNIAGPLEYFMKKRDAVESQVRQFGTGPTKLGKVDRSLFGQLKNPEKPLTPNYLRQVIKWAKWFLHDPDVAIRSIYHADEIAAITLFGLRDLWQYVPATFAEGLEVEGNTGYMARRSEDWAIASDARGNVVQTLKDLLAYVENELEEPLRNVFAEGLKRVGMLIDWNKDALEWASSSSSGSGSGGSETSPAENTPVSLPPIDMVAAGITSDDEVIVAAEDAEEIAEAEEPDFFAEVDFDTDSYGESTEMYIAPVAAPLETPFAVI